MFWKYPAKGKEMTNFNSKNTHQNKIKTRNEIQETINVVTKVFHSILFAIEMNSLFINQFSVKSHAIY